MNTKDSHDTELLAALASGHMEALHELYCRHACLVHRVALRYTQNEQDALDITQELFTDLSTLASKYRPKAKFTTWLYRVTANRCINWTRMAHRSRRVPLGQEGKEGHDGQWGRNGQEGHFQVLQDSSNPQPLEVYELKQRRAAVVAAINRLPPRQKMALTLKEYEGFSYQEIGAAMGCSKRAVESLLVRARRTLLETLEST